MKIIHVIGHSKSGKTTLVTGLIRYFRSKELSVGSIKSIHREDYSVDKEGGNSFLHRKAGASPVCTITSQDIAFFFEPDLSFDSIIKIFESLNTKILIIEGMKESAKECVVCAKDIKDAEALAEGKKVILFSGVLSSVFEGEIKGIPVLHTKEQIDEIGGILQEHGQ